MSYNKCFSQLSVMIDGEKSSETQTDFMEVKSLNLQKKLVLECELHVSVKFSIIQHYELK
jgi:hypothetical protein